ncbi:hypothetical protein HLA87_03025 [Mycoplasma miroungigenitalium]|uniref:Uncharacterized protein n=1 Tax=Mycoplasma miroungigenitalium TaxID=754515 RepID=A0A6M4JCI2_9MOLU|nr:hypothetical protein [Mycoplasma miroungigenitalium]QJR43736.1 hypothetical protein HLA87_03025 [Mycoplasma miroungigenitalium]
MKKIVTLLTTSVATVTVAGTVVAILESDPIVRFQWTQEALNKKPSLLLKNELKVFLKVNNFDSREITDFEIIDYNDTDGTLTVRFNWEGTGTNVNSNRIIIFSNFKTAKDDISTSNLNEKWFKSKTILEIYNSLINNETKLLENTNNGDSYNVKYNNIFFDNNNNLVFDAILTNKNPDFISDSSNRQFKISLNDMDSNPELIAKIHSDVVNRIKEFIEQLKKSNNVNNYQEIINSLELSLKNNSTFLGLDDAKEKINQLNKALEKANVNIDDKDQLTHAALEKLMESIKKGEEIRKILSTDPISHKNQLAKLDEELINSRKVRDTSPVMTLNRIDAQTKNQIIRNDIDNKTAQNYLEFKQGILDKIKEVKAEINYFNNSIVGDEQHQEIKDKLVELDKLAQESINKGILPQQQQELLGTYKKLTRSLLDLRGQNSQIDNQTDEINRVKLQQLINKINDSLVDEKYNDFRDNIMKNSLNELNRSITNGQNDVDIKQSSKYVDDIYSLSKAYEKFNTDYDVYLNEFNSLDAQFNSLHKQVTDFRDQLNDPIYRDIVANINQKMPQIASPNIIKDDRGEMADKNVKLSDLLKEIKSNKEVIDNAIKIYNNQITLLDKLSKDSKYQKTQQSDALNSQKQTSQDFITQAQNNKSITVQNYIDQTEALKTKIQEAAVNVYNSINSDVDNLLTELNKNSELYKDEIAALNAAKEANNQNGTNKINDYETIAAAQEALLKSYNSALKTSLDKSKRVYETAYDVAKQNAKVNNPDVYESAKTAYKTEITKINNEVAKVSIDDLDGKRKAFEEGKIALDNAKMEFKSAKKQIDEDKKVEYEAKASEVIDLVTKLSNYPDVVKELENSLKNANIAVGKNANGYADDKALAPNFVAQIVALNDAIKLANLTAKELAKKNYETIKNDAESESNSTNEQGYSGLKSAFDIKIKEIDAQLAVDLKNTDNSSDEKQRELYERDQKTIADAKVNFIKEKEVAKTAKHNEYLELAKKVDEYLTNTLTSKYKDINKKLSDIKTKTDATSGLNQIPSISQSLADIVTLENAFETAKSEQSVRANKISIKQIKDTEFNNLSNQLNTDNKYSSIKSFLDSAKSTAQDTLDEVLSNSASSTELINDTYDNYSLTIGEIKTKSEKTKQFKDDLDSLDNKLVDSKYVDLKNAIKDMSVIKPALTEFDNIKDNNLENMNKAIQKISEITLDIENIKTKFDDANTKLKDWETKFNELKTSHPEFTAEINEAITKLTQRTNSVAQLALNKNDSLLTELFDSTKNDYDNLVQKIEVKKKIEQEYSSELAKLMNLDSDVLNAKKAQESYNNDIAELYKKIELVKTQKIFDQSWDINTIEAKLAELKTNITSLFEEYKQNQLQQIEKDKLELNKISDQVDDLHSKLPNYYNPVKDIYDANQIAISQANDISEKISQVDTSSSEFDKINSTAVDNIHKSIQQGVVERIEPTKTLLNKMNYVLDSVDFFNKQLDNQNNGKLFKIEGINKQEIVDLKNFDWEEIVNIEQLTSKLEHLKEKFIELVDKNIDQTNARIFDLIETNQEIYSIEWLATVGTNEGKNSKGIKTFVQRALREDYLDRTFGKLEQVKQNIEEIKPMDRTNVSEIINKNMQNAETKVASDNDFLGKLLINKYVIIQEKMNNIVETIKNDIADEWFNTKTGYINLDINKVSIKLQSIYDDIQKYTENANYVKANAELDKLFDEFEQFVAEGNKFDIFNLINMLKTIVYRAQKALDSVKS